MTLDAGGNLGVGASTISARIHVVSGPGTPQVKWSDGTNGTATLDTASDISRIWSNVGLGFGTGTETYTERMRIDSVGNLIITTGSLREKQTAVAASNIDLSTGNVFTRTISGATTLTVSNIPASGTVASFILDLTNGGSGVVTWWANVKWAGGTAPTLTAAGRDVLGFFTHNGGTTWTGLLMGKDVK